MIRLYTDEDVTIRLSPFLWERGYNAVSVQEAGTRGFSDEDQLTFAARENRAILTFNTRDFVPLYEEWFAAGRDHSGIVVSTELTLPDLQKRVLALLESLSAYDMKNRLEWLNFYSKV